MSRILNAVSYAAELHKNQTRKFSAKDEPYINHPIRVANFVSKESWANEDDIIIAILHDVLEDCDSSFVEIQSLFGEVVAKGVDFLTDKFTSETFPNLNRKIRKENEAERLRKGHQSSWKNVKLIDILDNLNSISKEDSFFPTFKREALFLIEKLELGADIHSNVEGILTRKGFAFPNPRLTASVRDFLK